MSFADQNWVVIKAGRVVIENGELRDPFIGKTLHVAPDYDREVEKAYNALVQSFVDATARHIEQEIAVGRVLKLNAYETAKALVWMNERYLTLSLGREPTSERADVARTLHTIWSRVLYGKA